MTKFLRRLGRSLRKRLRQLGLRRMRALGQVETLGKATLHVPLLCDGAGRVVLGDGVHLGYEGAPRLGDGEIRLQARAPGVVIAIGAGTAFSNNVQVIAEAGVTIGARCLIGDAVQILDSDFHALGAADRHVRPGAAAPVVLEDNVFIGSRAILLKGVTIGRNSVIGAGSVVVRSIPPGVIAAGNPAKVLRPLPPDHDPLP
jgi:maltose O-acetyltransferase